MPITTVADAVSVTQINRRGANARLSSGCKCPCRLIWVSAPLRLRTSLIVEIGVRPKGIHSDTQLTRIDCRARHRRTLDRWTLLCRRLESQMKSLVRFWRCVIWFSHLYSAASTLGCTQQHFRARDEKRTCEQRTGTTCIFPGERKNTKTNNCAASKETSPRVDWAHYDRRTNASDNESIVAL